MVVDRYTKMVLTVIAVALAVLAGTQVVALFAPGTAIAADRSIETILACACGERSSLTCRRPSIAISNV